MPKIVILGSCRFAGEISGGKAVTFLGRMGEFTIHTITQRKCVACGALKKKSRKTHGKDPVYPDLCKRCAVKASLAKRYPKPKEVTR